MPKPNNKVNEALANASAGKSSTNAATTVETILANGITAAVEKVSGVLGEDSALAASEESLLQFAKEQGWWKSLPDWFTGAVDPSDTKDDGEVRTNKGGKGKGIATPQVWQRVNTMQTVGKARTQIDQMNLLADRVAALGNSINGMKVVMDSGALVGQIQAPIDRQLGMNALYSGRR